MLYLCIKAIYLINIVWTDLFEGFVRNYVFIYANVDRLNIWVTTFSMKALKIFWSLTCN